MNLKEQIEKFVPSCEQEESDRRIILKNFETYSDLLTRNNETCHFTASSWIVNKERTKALMIFHNIYNSWAWTGGHADGDADLLNVALKEAREETDIKNLKVLTNDIATIEIITVDSHIKRGKFVSSHLHLNCSFVFEADEMEELKIKEDENSGVAWIELDKLDKYVSEPKMLQYYDKLTKIAKNIK